MSNAEVSIGHGSLAIPILFIAFWGEPDLVDALITLILALAGR